MPTTQTLQVTIGSATRYGRYVGRVGGLAVALGIGLAIANNPAVAIADEGSSASGSSSAGSSSAGSSSAGSSSAGSSSAGSSKAESSGSASKDSPSAEASTESYSPTSANATDETEDTDDTADAEDTADTDADTDDTDDTDDADADADADDDDDTVREDTEEVAVRVTPVETADDTSDSTTDPVAPAALLTIAGSARREPGTEAAASTDQPASGTEVLSSDTSAAVSPLGTEQQLEAERIAAQTVKTLPVRLMKLVLRLGWLATAHREYGLIGGPDRENLAQLTRAVDEYAMGAAFQQQLLNSMQPTVVMQVAPPHTWFGQKVGGSRILYDNPDTIYRFMGVNTTSSYVITGRIIGEMPADTSFSLLTGLSGVTADYLSGRDLQVDTDGYFTITVSSEPAAPGQRNHLQLTSDSTLVAVRNTLSDWNNESPMSLSIERVSGPPNSLFSQLGGFAIPLLGPTVATSPLLTALVSLIPPMKTPPPILRGTLTAVVMALGLSQEAKYIKVATTDPETGERVQPNVMPQPSRNAQFLATQLQSAGYFELADDQALVVTITPNNARYFTVPVTNLWTVTDDYWNEQTSLNNAQAVANPDGTYTLVISPTDPGVHNWVSTGGLNQGTISIRFQDLDLGSTVTPTVTSQLVSLADLESALPPSTQYVSPWQRYVQLAARKSGFDKRFAPYTQ